MESAREFMERYFRESFASEQMQQRQSELFNKQFYSADYMQHLLRAWEHKVPETLQHIEATDEAAVIISTVQLRGGKKRRRYHLRASDHCWEIHRNETECFACRGTGRREENACTFCQGKGWVDWLCDTI